MIERVRAPAKINLRLRVREREPDGYHVIETLFCALELADELTVELEDPGAEAAGAPGSGAGPSARAGSGPEVRLEVDGPDLGPGEQNLAFRAARDFLAAAGLARSVSVRLRKRIPAGAGLGGGSSDAAAVLRALEGLLPGALDSAELEGLARSLGADVPFFFGGTPLARATGRGDVLEPAPALPSAPVLLVFPGFGVSTAAAYGWVDEDRARGLEPRPPTGEPAPGPPHSWDEAARLAVNDFEGPVFRRHPELGELSTRLRDAGAAVALLAGSGSTLFGVFRDDGEAERALALLRARAPAVQLTRTRTAAR